MRVEVSSGDDSDALARASRYQEELVLLFVVVATAGGYID